MEGNTGANNPTDKADIDKDEAEEVVALEVTPTRIQFKDSLPSRSSREFTERGRSMSKGRSPSPPPVNLGPGFADYTGGSVGDVGGHGYDETEVDIIAVPCPGADPIQTWIYDSDSSIETRSHISHDNQSARSSTSSLRRSHPWVTFRLRERVSIARVFLYKHRHLQDGMNLKSMADDLLEQVESIRDGSPRPLFFIAHSIGGLVVKNALARAAQKPNYQTIVDNCHGVTFFGTPHHGSSYLSMPNLKESIQDLLQLEAPLPKSLTDEIRVNNPKLKALHRQFVDSASELRLWSFHETRESVLSGYGAQFTNEVQFRAPLVSVNSALLGLWEEDIFGLESTHAHLAAFGPDNEEILVTYLENLRDAVLKSAELSRRHAHHPLHLTSLVQVEVIGFYEDPDAWTRQYAGQESDPGAESGSVIRLYATKYPYKEFLNKGPEKCLSERLQDRSQKRKRRARSPDRAGGRTGLAPPQLPQQTTADANILGISQDHGSGAAATGPEITINTGSPVVSENPLPSLLQIRAQTMPALRPPTPDSVTSMSTTMSDPLSVHGKQPAGDGPLTVGLLAKQQAEIMLKEHELAASAGFTRPKPDLRKFTWIHTPFNNPSWVWEIFQVLSQTQGHDFSKLFEYENWESKHQQNRHSEYQPAFLKSTCKYLTNTSITSPWPTPLVGPSTFSLSSSLSPNCLFVYMPYLHFDTYRNMVKRRRIIKERRERGRAKPVPKSVAEEESLELKMIWEYIGFDPPLNCRRTLDQFGHHSLPTTESRDDDQMLYKLTKKTLSSTKPVYGDATKSQAGPARSSMYSNKGSMGSNIGSRNDEDHDHGHDGREKEPELLDGYVLMVDQLWLWSVDKTTLATFFPRRYSNPTEGTLFHQADLRNSVYNELNGDLTGVSGRTENALDLAALIVYHAIIVFLDRSNHPDLEIFRLFDEAIGMLAERMTLNMKQFRLQSLNIDDEEDDDEDTDYSDWEGESPSSIKKRHRKELERSERENRENTSALLELADLKDELTVLQTLFKHQDTIVRQMRDFYETHCKETKKNWQEVLDDALEYLEDFRDTVTEMLERVNTTRKDYEKFLEMVQRQAQVDEVRWSRLQAELAASQNLSVMIFTTFTVIFLPLTFFTGLFGMNVTNWVDATDGMPDLDFVGRVSLPSSAALIIFSLVAAFSWKVQRGFKGIYNMVRDGYKKVKKGYTKKLEPMWRKEKKMKRREENKRKFVEKQTAWNKDGTYDFWANVKRQQQKKRYRIPEQNRRS
ncbi:hypothetical protein QBC40DRAFT_90669 [Triangularia verruculosa]|uniref:DUF676 domain-containing protein n=1 Tax=Triangularia verruculosa TaxID=2587418 RepID=A0AAN7ATA8_9PEZI|nr:hypothetical protein QBC40DRAFT_90669 [Triangularia verruculosa]